MKNRYVLNILIFILAALLSGTLICKVFAEDISFEWSAYKEGECTDCTFFDLYKNGEIVIPDIPINTLTATVTDQIFAECPEYSLTARNSDSRSGKSTVVKICQDEGPTITKITQIK